MMLLQDYEGWDTSRVAGLVCGFLFQQHSLKITAICTTHLPIVQFNTTSTSNDSYHWGN